MFWSNTSQGTRRRQTSMRGTAGGWSGPRRLGPAIHMPRSSGAVSLTKPEDARRVLEASALGRTLLPRSCRCAEGLPLSRGVLVAHCLGGEAPR